MRVGVIGINHKLANLHVREALAKAFQKRFGTEKVLHPGHHFILLLTCNRTEIYFSSHNLTESHAFIIENLRKELSFEFEQKLYSFFSWDCFFHLAKVTAGLDSALFGESEIQGQVKSAYINNSLNKPLAKELHFLFQKSLKIGKEIRTRFTLSKGLSDLEHAVFNTGKKIFNDLEKTKILFIGASEINLKVLNFLKKQLLSNITLCNRTRERTLEIQNKLGISELLWENLDQWEQFDWVILGTKFPGYLINKETLGFSDKEQKLIIDLSVPRNVDPEIVKNTNICLYNIDDMHRLLISRKRENLFLIKSALEHVHGETKKLCKLFLKKENNLKQESFQESKEMCFA